MPELPGVGPDGGLVLGPVRRAPPAGRLAGLVGLAAPPHAPMRTLRRQPRGPGGPLGDRGVRRAWKFNPGAIGPLEGEPGHFSGRSWAHGLGIGCRGDGVRRCALGTPVAPREERLRGREAPSWARRGR